MKIPTTPFFDPVSNINNDNITNSGNSLFLSKYMASNNNTAKNEQRFIASALTFPDATD